MTTIGIFYVIGKFKKTKDDEDDRLIKILKDTVDTLETKVETQKNNYENNVKELNMKIDKLTKKVDTLDKENNRLVSILQGRDEQTKKFYEQSFESMKLIQQDHNLMVELANDIKKSNENTNRIINMIEKKFM